VLQHKLEEGIKRGDLVWFQPAHRACKKRLGVFLGLKTFDEKYICAMVFLKGQERVRPIQCNLLTKVTNENR